MMPWILKYLDFVIAILLKVPGKKLVDQVPCSKISTSCIP